MTGARLVAAAVIAFSLLGCGGPVNTLLRSTASLAVTTTGGYRGLRAYDAVKQAGIQARARSGDPIGAEEEMGAYVAKRDVALKVLDAASVGVEGAYAAVPTVDQALDKKRRAEIAAWIPTLIKLGADVAQALGVLGVKIPSPGGAP